MTAAVLLALSLAAASPSQPGQDECVLPKADDREGQSQPSFEGAIASVRGNDIRLTLGQPRSDVVTVSLRKRSDLFTAYGGHVARSELQTGQRVRVWLEDCGRGSQQGRRVVAVMELASTRPGDEFP